MDHRTEDIRSLMLEKLDNHIAPEDEQLLQRLITEEESVRTMWTEVQELFAAGEGRKMLDELNTQREWEAFNEALKKARRRKLITYISAVSAAAATIAGILLYFNLNKSSNKTQLAAARPNKSILLQIDNGNTIDLSDEDNEAITAGDARLKNNGKMLTLQGGLSTQWSKIIVPPGMDYQVKLSDNSTLWLNAATTARFPVNFTGRTREIEIHGEAYLQVAKDASRPFIVHLPDADVQVLGTAFNINTYDSGVSKVALVEGSVHMRTGAQTVALQPGYQASTVTNAPMLVAPFDQQQVLAWMKGQYIFSNTPVQEIARTIHRWFDVEVVIDNAVVGQKCFTGIINKQKDLQAFLNDLSETAEVNHYFRGAVLHFK